MLAALLASFAVYSQEPGAGEDIDSIEPGVDAAALEELGSDVDGVDDIDPAVPSAVLAEDVTRSSAGSGVMDRLELGRTEITGNQELPKVLYIVPWQKADPGELMGKPVNTLLDEVLAPIDREEFLRSVDYYEELHGREGE